MDKRKKNENHYCLYYSAIPLRETSTSTRTQTVVCQALGEFFVCLFVSFEGKVAVLAPSLQKTYTPVALWKGKLCPAKPLLSSTSQFKLHSEALHHFAKIIAFVLYKNQKKKKACIANICFHLLRIIYIYTGSSVVCDWPSDRQPLVTLLASRSVPC